MKANFITALVIIASMTLGCQGKFLLIETEESGESGGSGVSGGSGGSKGKGDKGGKGESGGSGSDYGISNLVYCFGSIDFLCGLRRLYLG